MPVYEFYCPDCHIIFNFLSRRVNTDKQPDCPRCGRPNLDRQVSRFAVAKGRQEDAGEVMQDLDEERVEKAVQTLSGEIDRVDENDPRQMARFMRKFGEVTGMDLGTEVEEAIRRLEAGEDPEKIEAEMGELLEVGDQLARQGAGKVKRQSTPPERDDNLYLL